jgi:hypothetical protein
LLAVALRDTAVQELFREVDAAIFDGAEQQLVASFIISHIGAPVEGVPADLQAYQKYVTMLLLNPDVETLDWNEQSRVASSAQVLQSLRRNYEIQQLQQKIEQADNNGDDDTATALRQQLMKEMKHGQR